MVNCAIPGCHVSHPRYKGISLFKIPQRKSEFFSNWRKCIVDVLSKYREMSPSFKREIIDCKRDVFICEKHFTEKDIILTPTNKKTLDDMALPTLNLPQKSFTSIKSERKLPKERPFPVLNYNDHDVSSQDFSAEVNPQNYYETVEDLISDFKKINEESSPIHWSFESQKDEDFRVFCYEKPYLVPKYDMFIDSSFKVNLFVFGWLVPNTNNLFSVPLQNVSISTFLEKLVRLSLCPGLLISNDCISHVIPTRIDYKKEISIPFTYKTFFRSAKCIMLCEENSLCSRCSLLHEKVKKKIDKPLHPNTPLSSVISDKRVINEIKSVRKENTNLKKQLRKECEHNNKHVNSDLASDLNTIMAQNEGKVTPFMKLFWEEQKKLNKSSKGNRYHPVII